MTHRAVAISAAEPRIGYLSATMLAVPPAGVVGYDGMARRIVAREHPRAPIRFIGAQGDGPGEYCSISALMVRGDTLTVTDGGQRRVTNYLLSSGEALTTVRTPTDATWRSQLIQPFATLAGRCWLGVVQRGTPRPRASRIPWTVTRTIVRVREGPRGRVIESLGAESDEGQFIVPYGEMSANRIQSVSATIGRVLVSQDGSSVAMISPVFSPHAGVVIRKWRAACEPEADSLFVPLPEREMSESRARSIYRRQLTGRQDDPKLLPKAIEDALEQTPRRRGRLREPLFTHALLADDGSVWLEVEGTAMVADHGGPRVWWVVGPDGGVRTSLRVPRDIRLRVTDGSRALGWRTSAMGADIVELTL